MADDYERLSDKTELPTKKRRYDVKARRGAASATVRRGTTSGTALRGAGSVIASMLAMASRHYATKLGVTSNISTDASAPHEGGTGR